MHILFVCWQRANNYWMKLQSVIKTSRTPRPAFWAQKGPSCSISWRRWQKMEVRSSRQGVNEKRALQVRGKMCFAVSEWCVPFFFFIIWELKHVRRVVRWGKGRPGQLVWSWMSVTLSSFWVSQDAEWNKGLWHPKVVKVFLVSVHFCLPLYQ